jgi:hypothetical protein
MFSFLAFLEEQFHLTLQYHSKLNPVIWDGKKLRPGIKEQLLRHADRFAKHTGISLGAAKDIIITGSNVNYNYTRHSDLDVHIIIDTQKSDTELYQARSSWAAKNKNLTLTGVRIPYPIEFYVENARDRHSRPSGQGVYSLKQDKWLIEPKKLDVVNLMTDPRVLVKVKHELDYVKNYLLKKGTKQDIISYKEKLWKHRDAGLHKAGEFSIENMIYKDLRNRGLIDKLNQKLN